MAEKKKGLLDLIQAFANTALDVAPQAGVAFSGDPNSFITSFQAGMKQAEAQQEGGFKREQISQQKELKKLFEGAAKQPGMKQTIAAGPTGFTTQFQQPDPLSNPYFMLALQDMTPEQQEKVLAAVTGAGASPFPAPAGVSPDATSTPFAGGVPVPQGQTYTLNQQTLAQQNRINDTRPTRSEAREMKIKGQTVRLKTGDSKPINDDLYLKLKDRAEKKAKEILENNSEFLSADSKRQQEMLDEFARPILETEISDLGYQTPKAETERTNDPIAQRISQLKKSMTEAQIAQALRQKGIDPKKYGLNG